MSPVSSSPIHKMAQPQRTASQDSDGIRKRVCKACDRCRLKKSKCDGSNPCSRCKADNAICVFGERKKSHDKVYPKGYVEMLEQQQSQLVSGLQEMYRRLRNGQKWDGAALSEANGHPLTHDILAALNLLDSKADGTDVDAFEEDVQKLQSRLLAEGAGFANRRGSMSSDSEHSLHDHTRSGSHSTPVLNQVPPVFRDSFHFSAPSSPHPGSPVINHRPPFPPQQLSHMSQMSSMSQFSQNSPLSHDPQFYQAEWAFPDMSSHSHHQHHHHHSNSIATADMSAEKLLRARLAMQAAQMEQSMSLAGGMAELEQSAPHNWDSQSSTMPYDMNAFNMGTWPAQQLMTAFASTLPRASAATATAAVVADVANPAELEQMDVDLSQYIQVVT